MTARRSQPKAQPEAVGPSDLSLGPGLAAKVASPTAAEQAIGFDPATVLEAHLLKAERAARVVIAEHAPAVNAVFAAMSPSEQKSWCRFAEVFGPPLIEHHEPHRRRPCTRCEAARRLLVYAHEVRFNLAKGAPEVAVLQALTVGRLQLRLGLATVEDNAERGQAFADGPRRPRRDRLNRALEEMLANKPDLTTADVLAAWAHFDGAPACIVDVESDGTVSWTTRHGNERTTSSAGLTKRLQRLRRK